MPELPNDLSKSISMAIVTIDSNGELPAANRLKIHQLMEQFLSIRHANAPRYTRAKLAMLCAYSSLPLLKFYPIIKPTAENILQNGIKSLQGKFDSDILESENAILSENLINLMKEENPFISSIYAGLSCSSAINTILYDDDLASLELEEKQSDPADWDAAFYASLAHSGGATWENTGDKEKRKDFWLWYLNKAIPYAWDESTPLIPTLSFN